MPMSKPCKQRVIAPNPILFWRGCKSRRRGIVMRPKCLILATKRLLTKCLMSLSAQRRNKDWWRRNKEWQRNAQQEKNSKQSKPKLNKQNNSKRWWIMSQLGTLP